MLRLVLRLSTRRTITSTCGRLNLGSPFGLSYRSASVPAVMAGLDRSSHPESFPPPGVTNIVAEVSAILKSRKETISVAETAAGGIISSSLLSQPGASSIYKGGLTLYTLPSRIAYAGWTQDTISNYAGPTKAVVSGLAEHVRRDLESTYTIAESGTAGPTGGQAPNRHPGYVALAVSCDRGTFVRELNTGLGSDRVGNMVQFAVEALKLLRDVLNGDVTSLERAEAHSTGVSL